MKKSKLYLIISIILTIITLVNVCLVVTHKLNNAGFTIVPMVFAIGFIVSYKNSKNDKGGIK
jgi:hypothetical protein